MLHVFSAESQSSTLEIVDTDNSDVTKPGSSKKQADTEMDMFLNLEEGGKMCTQLTESIEMFTINLIPYVMFTDIVMSDPEDFEENGPMDIKTYEKLG